MNEQKWRSPTGHPIASHETDRMIETPTPQGWSAIETAPKDGTEILLSLWSGHPEHKTSFCWAINGYYKDGFFYSKDPMIGKLASPTHWQHITAPTPAPTEKTIVSIKFHSKGDGFIRLENEHGHLFDVTAPVEKFEYIDDLEEELILYDMPDKTFEDTAIMKAARAYLKLQSATKKD